MKYDMGFIHAMLKDILDWQNHEKDSILYKEIQVLIRKIEIDLGLDDY